jgi:hypothetical protein
VRHFLPKKLFRDDKPAKPTFMAGLAPSGPGTDSRVTGQTAE